MRLTAVALLAVFAGPVLAGEAPHPFSVQDLVMLDRISDPQLAPDGNSVVFSVRETDYAANKRMNSVWRRVLTGTRSQSERLTAKGINASNPRWSSDGKSVFFISDQSGNSQLWRLDSKGGNARQMTSLPLDITAFAVSPNGRQLVLSMEVYSECADLACNKKRLDEKAAGKVSGTVHDQLFVRHWDTWADGRHSQLFIADLDSSGAIIAEPKWISRGVSGDIPWKPHGDDSDFSFSPDGKSLYFSARLANATEAWSTNFDIYVVPVDGSMSPKNLTADNPAWDAHPVISHDGKTLYYTAMKRPAFEADRFAIMEKDLATGKTREIDPNWDRSAEALKLSRSGRTLYTSTDDRGEHAVFAVDIKTGKINKITGYGKVEGFDIAGDSLVFGRSTLQSPTDLFRVELGSTQATQITHFNDDRLAQVKMGDFDFFTFKGWNDEKVEGYVVKPVNYKKGKKYPIAFIIHGGPQGANNNEFHYRWNPQTYAGQGFAVVSINFHGSTGYGQSFTDSISGDWGGKPLEDLKKGYAAALAKYDFLDASRACALGASYGGYMVNWIAGNWQDPWKCLISHDGVFDSRMMYYSTDELWFDEWEHQGTQFDKPEAFEKHNPVNYVTKWKVPMLVIHSDKDFRIPVEQGIAAFTALQRRGIPSEFLNFPDENHWVLKPQNSVLWHDTVNQWLKRWLGEGK